jgi:hypothetical protein
MQKTVQTMQHTSMNTCVCVLVCTPLSSATSLFMQKTVHAEDCSDHAALAWTLVSTCACVRVCMCVRACVLVCTNSMVLKVIQHWSGGTSTCHAPMLPYWEEEEQTPHIHGNVCCKHIHTQFIHIPQLIHTHIHSFTKRAYLLWSYMCVNTRSPTDIYRHTNRS